MSRRDLDQQKVEKEIWRALELALAEYDTALTRFEQIIAALTSHQPSQDEIIQFEKGAVARRLAFRIYERAMRRLTVAMAKRVLPRARKCFLVHR